MTNRDPVNYARLRYARCLFLVIAVFISVSCNSDTNGTEGGFISGNTNRNTSFVSTLHGFSVDLPTAWQAINFIGEVRLASSQEALFGATLGGRSLTNEMQVTIGELEPDSDIVNGAAEKSLAAIFDNLIASLEINNDDGLGEQKYDSTPATELIYQSIDLPALDGKLYIGLVKIDDTYFSMAAMSTLDRTEEADEEQLTTIAASIQMLDSVQITKGNRYQSPMYGLSFERPDGLEIAHGNGGFIYAGRTQQEISHTYRGTLEDGEIGSYIGVTPKDAALFCNEPFDAHTVVNNIVASGNQFSLNSEIEEIELDNGYLLKAYVDNSAFGLETLMLALELDEVFVLVTVYEGGGSVSNSTEELYMELVKSIGYEPSKNVEYLFNVVNVDMPLTETFNSPLGGITVDLPSGWTAEDVSTPTILFNMNFGAIATLMSPNGISSMIQAPTALDSLIGGDNLTDLASAGTDLGMILSAQFGDTETRQIRTNGNCLIEMGGETFTGGYMHTISVILPDGRKTAFVTASEHMPDETIRETYENAIRAIAASAR